MSLRRHAADLHSRNTNTARTGDWDRLVSHPHDSLLTHVERRVDADYRDKTELIVGGCKPTPTPSGPNVTEDEKREARLATGCFDDWLAAFTNRALDNGTANTILMLATGKAVLELSALKTVLQARAENEKDAITHILLVDPFVSNEEKEEIKTEFNNLLLEVQVEYFNTLSAYDNCFAYLKNNPTLLVAAIGGINFGYMMSTHKTHRRLINDMIMVIEFAQQRLIKNSEWGLLFVVTGFKNSEGEYVIRDEMSVEFISRFETQLARWTQLYERELRNPRPKVLDLN